MTVKELYDILARLPADAPVFLAVGDDAVGESLAEVREEDGEVFLLDQDPVDDRADDDDDDW